MIASRPSGFPTKRRLQAVGGGIRLADGKVVALGVKPGDDVLVGLNTGSDIVINGEDHVVLRESEVLAIAH